MTISQLAISDNLNMARSDVSKAICKLSEVGIIKRESSKFSRTLSLNIDLDNLDTLIENALTWIEKE
jgi:predicted transcriptional regulator